MVAMKNVHDLVFCVIRFHLYHLFLLSQNAESSGEDIISFIFRRN